MPIVAAGFITNTPYFLPGIKSKFRSKLTITSHALAKLARIIRKHRPEVVVIITQSNTWDNIPLWFWQQSDYLANFHTVGDLVTHKKFSGATGFIHSLKEFLEKKISVPLRTVPELPTDIAIPLFYSQIDCLVAPINLSPLLPMDDLLHIGKIMQDFFSSRPEKIVVLAAGIPAHIPQKEQGDYKIYITNLRKILKTANYSRLLELDNKLRQAVQENCLLPLSLMYILLDTQVKTLILADEDDGLIHQLITSVTW